MNVRMGRCLAPFILMATLLACNLSRITVAGEVGTPAPTGQPAAVLTPGTESPRVVTPNHPGRATSSFGALGAGDLLLAYVKDSALWLWSNGSARQLTRQGAVFQPKISPDRAWIAFLRPADEFHIELWAVKVDGTAEHALVTITDLDAIGVGARDPNAVAVIPAQFDWLPNSHVLAFNTQQVFNGPGGSRLDDLHLADPEAPTGQAIQHIFLPGWGGDFAFSPDGKQVALARADTLLLSQADGSQLRELMKYDLVLTYSEYRYYALPLWSPDAVYLRVVFPPADPLAPSPQPTELWKIPLDSAPQQEGGVQALPFFDAPLIYSPDLAQITYLTQDAPSNSPRQLHLGGYDGQGDRVYASAPLLRFVAWSPDSRMIAYVIGDQQELWIGPADGSPQPYTAIPSGLVDMRWIGPTRFVATRQQSDRFTLLLADLSGQTLELDSFTAAPPEFDVR
jgi:hypothetical protein